MFRPHFTGVEVRLGDGFAADVRGHAGASAQGDVSRSRGIHRTKAHLRDQSFSAVRELLLIYCLAQRVRITMATSRSAPAHE